MFILVQCSSFVPPEFVSSLQSCLNLQSRIGEEIANLHFSPGSSYPSRDGRELPNTNSAGDVSE